MSLARHTAFLLLLAPIVCESSGTSFLQRLVSRQRSFTALRFSPQDPAARTLLALDTNHDGSIDPNEVAAFAREKGLDPSAATQEFSSIDTNGDGVLDSAELQQVLGGQVAAAQSAGAQTAEAAPVAATLETVVEEPPLAAAAPSAPQPTSTVAVEAPLAQAATVAAEIEAPLVQAATAVAAEAPLAQAATVTVEAPLAQAPSGVEAELVSAKVLAAPVGPASTAPGAELISEESRTSMREAAQQVSEELMLEEKEELAARSLDRQAAEIRANSTALAKQTVEDALDAGAAAAHTMADDLMERISSIEDQAEKAEVRAAALRAKSKMELEEGNQLMAVADQALRLGPHI